MQLFVFGDCPHVIFGPVIFYAGGGVLKCGCMLHFCAAAARMFWVVTRVCCYAVTMMFWMVAGALLCNCLGVLSSC